MRLIDVSSGCNALVLIKTSNDIPFSLAWKIDDIIEFYEKHNKRFHKERNDLLSKYGVARKDNNEVYDIPAENVEEYKNKALELENYEIEINTDLNLNIEELMSLDIVVPKEVDIKALKCFVNNKINK